MARSEWTAALFTALVFCFVGRSADASLWSSSCDFNRDDALKCMINKIDVNQDGTITVNELDVARSKLPWALWLLAKAYSNERLLWDCDANGDGVFTPLDFEQSTRTCLPTQWSLCQFKDVCDQYSRT